MATDQAKAEGAIERTLDRADRVYGSSPQALKQMLADADKALAARLAKIQKKHGGPTGAFTEEAAKLTRQQVQLAQKYVDQRLLGLTHGQASKAVALSVGDTVKLAKTLERHFTGISRPLNLEQAAVLDPLISGTNSSLLQRHKASVQRYGQAMVADFERVIRTGFVEGLTNHEVIKRMIGTGAVGGITAAGLSGQPGFPKPTGYMRKQYWAERIVRTETAYAYNRANLSTLHEAQNQDFPDMQKKILATFDKRTAPDSIAVHGQIRDLDKNFRDGKGREYMHPPARPNDRETVVPWRPEWSELPNTVPTPPKQAALAEVEELPKTGMSGKQKQMAMRQAIAAKKAEILAQQAKAKASQNALKSTIAAAQAAQKQGKGLAGAAMALDVEAASAAKLMQAAKLAAQSKGIKKAQAALEKAKAYKIAIAQKAQKAAMEKKAKAAAKKALILKTQTKKLEGAAIGLQPDNWMGPVMVQEVKDEFPAFLEAYKSEFGAVPKSLKEGKNLKMWMLKYGKAKQGAEAFSAYGKLGKKLNPAQLMAAAKPSQKHKHATKAQISAAEDYVEDALIGIEVDAVDYYATMDQDGIRKKIIQLHAQDPEKVAIEFGSFATKNPKAKLAAELLDAGDIEGAAKAYSKLMISDEQVAQYKAMQAAEEAEKKAKAKAAAEAKKKAEAEAKAAAEKKLAEKAAAEKIAEAKNKAAEDVDLFAVMDAGNLESMASASPQVWLGPQGTEAIKKDMAGFLSLYEKTFGEVPVSLKQGKNVKMFAAKLGKKMAGADAYKGVSKYGKLPAVSVDGPKAGAAQVEETLDALLGAEAPKQAAAKAEKPKAEKPAAAAEKKQPATAAGFELKAGNKQDDWLLKAKKQDAEGLLDAKESGGYVDIFSPSGEKLTYFKKSGSDFSVDPPGGLGLESKAFKDIEKAVDYALDVSHAIQKKNAMTAAEKAAAAVKLEAEQAKKKAEDLKKLREQSAKRNQIADEQKKKILGKGKNPKLSEIPDIPLPAHAVASSTSMYKDGSLYTFEGEVGPSVRRVREVSSSLGEGLDISQTNKRAFVSFTGGAYSSIRDSERETNRSGKPTGKLLPPSERGETAKKIHKGFEQLRGQLPEDIDGLEVWRGTRNMPLKIAEEYLRTGKFDHSGTASTSRRKAVAYNFANVTDEGGGKLSTYADEGKAAFVYRMRNKSGVPIETISNYDTENEVLTQAGTEYRLTNMYWAPGSNKKVLIIEGEEL